MELRWERKFKEQEDKMTKQINAMLNAQKTKEADLQTRENKLKTLADELEKKFMDLVESAPGNELEQIPTI
jgi:hypothetical protein